MRKFTLLLLSGLFPGFASYVEPNKCDPEIDADSNKELPEKKNVDWDYLNGADRTIAIDGKNNYIFSSMQMVKGSIDELPDDIKKRTTARIKKLNQRVGYKTNYPDIILKKNEFNQIKIYENN